jgi:hypothetical protein
MDGQGIRRFFRELFGSRVTEQLENELMRARSDYDTRLHERDETIADQRARIALLEGKIDRYEMVLLPLSSPVGNFFNNKREPISELLPEKSNVSSWQEYKMAYESEQEKELEAESSV